MASQVAASLLEWLPQLRSLKIDTSYVHGNAISTPAASSASIGGDSPVDKRDLPVYNYSLSESCALKVHQKRHRKRHVLPFAIQTDGVFRDHGQTPGVREL